MAKVEPNKQFHFPPDYLLLLLFLLILWPNVAFCLADDAQLQMLLLEEEVKKGSLLPSQTLERLNSLLLIDARFSPLLDPKGKYWIPEDQEKYLRSNKEKAWMLKEALKFLNFEKFSEQEHQDLAKLLEKHVTGQELDDLRIYITVKESIHTIEEVTLSDEEIAKRDLSRLMDGEISPSYIQSSDTIIVPDVTGKKIADAVEALEQAGLNIKTRLTKTQSNEQANFVFAQDTLAGESVNRNAIITLDVYILGNNTADKINAHLFETIGFGAGIGSGQAEKVKVPNVKGLKIAEAVPILEKAGLKIKTEITKSRDKSEANIVFSQNKTGTDVNKGTEIILSVYMFDPLAPVSMCSSVLSNYKKAMISKTPDFQIGKDMLVKAEGLDCWYLEKINDHFAKSTAEMERVTTERRKQETLCKELYSSYKDKMAGEGKHVDFDRGRQILTSAQHCEWYGRAQEHYTRSRAAYEEHIDTQQEECLNLQAQLVTELSAARETLDTAKAFAILDSSKNCAWFSHQQRALLCLDGEINAVKALNNGIIQNAKKWISWGQNQNCAYPTQLSSMIDRTEKLNDQQKVCDDLYEKYSNSVQDSNKSLDSNEVKAIIASSENCSWYSRAKELIPCMDGEFQGLSAFNGGDLETAAHWAQWGKSTHCAYTERLFVLIQQEETARKQQQYCQQLGEQAALAAAKADKTLDASELKEIVASAQGCPWSSNVSAVLPCLDGEHHALRAYNAGDLKNAVSWTDWGRENNCSYVDRVSGLINQQVTQRQQQNVQQKPGFWETFGQTFAKEMEAYNQQMNAQMQQQTQQYLNQAIQQQFQQKSVPEHQQQRPLQRQQKPVAAASRSQPASQPSVCSQLDSQIFAACKGRNNSLTRSLLGQSAARNCRLSTNTTYCLEHYADEWLDGFEKDMQKTFNPNEWKVKVQ